MNDTWGLKLFYLFSTESPFLLPHVQHLYNSMIYNVYKVADVSKYAVTSATKKVHQVFKKDDELFKKVDGL